ncbi:MAG: O-acetyl-ADP-ribose deacetylase [Acidobacteria bacterium]|nr:O-acetyl-ADP-ribose deacetylase [Acidobacteriota bacterium]
MNRVTIGQAVLELIEGDITKQDTDAIVNAANSGLRGGGGVDGAIHRAGGPDIMFECRKIGHCSPGEAVVTTAGKLKSHYVIHTVGPIWHGGKEGESEILQNAYLNSLKKAESLSLRTIAFPSISTGVYGYPVDQASMIALKTCVKFLQEKAATLKLIRFVLFGEENYSVYKKALNEIM